jgi:hypothetical protein
VHPRIALPHYYLVGRCDETVIGAP